MLVPAWRSVKPSGPAHRRAVWVAQHTHAGLLSSRQEAGPDYGNEIDLRQIQSFQLHGDTGRGVLKRSSDHTAIIVVQSGSCQSEKRNTQHAQQFGNCTQRLGHSVADTESSSGSPFHIGPGSSLVHATRQRVRSRTTKPGNMKRRTESQKSRKFCGGNPQQESPLNKSSGGNSTAEINSKNLCLSNCSPRDVIIIGELRPCNQELGPLGPRLNLPNPQGSLCAAGVRLCRRRRCLSSKAQDGLRQQHGSGGAAAAAVAAPELHEIRAFLKMQTRSI